MQRRRELLEAERLEQALAQETREVLRLSESHLQHLDREVRTLLQLAAQREERLAAALARLQEARERYRRAQEAWQQCREELERYEAADRRVAQALSPDSPPQNILAALDRVRALIREIEITLSQAIEENEMRQQRKPITFSSQGDSS
jgi:cysteinyl-tRNA synthetase